MTNLAEIAERAHASQDYSELLQLIPYAVTLGLECHRFGDDVIFRLPARAENLGNPVLPAIHGGVIGGSMELSASLYLIMFQKVPQMPRIVDFSIDFLRAALNRDTFFECELTRQGNRVANVLAHAWQTRRQSPVALARAHFLLDSRGRERGSADNVSGGSS